LGKTKRSPRQIPNYPHFWNSAILGTLPCAECDRLWATYVYTLKELSRMLLPAELSGDKRGLHDMEDSRALVRDALREHALTHIEEAILTVSASG